MRIEIFLLFLMILNRFECIRVLEVNPVEQESQVDVIEEEG